MTDQAPSQNEKIARKQKVIALAILGALAVFAVSAVVVSEPKTPKKRVSDTTTFSIRPESADRDALIARYDARFLAMSKDIEKVRQDAVEREAKLRATIAEQEKTITEQTRTMIDLKTMAGRAGLMPRPGETPEETEARIARLLKSQADAAYIQDVTKRFGSKTPGPVISPWPEHQGQPMVDTSQTPSVPTGARQLASSGTASSGRLTLVTMEGPSKSQIEEPSKPRVGPSPYLKPDTPLSMNRAAGTTVSDYLPAGSFVRGRLLTGVYAATGAAAASQPLPMVIRLENKAILPNEWRSQVTSCHVTASATGDLSSERVFIRLDRLSCVGKRGETLDVRVTGYAVGEDGKVGVRGKLVTRSGQAIASALSVGLLSGIGNAVSRSNEEITTSITGTQSKRYTNAWASGLGEGMSDAMDRITDYYLKLADRIFPVLEVDAGRPVDIVLSQGVLLSPTKPNS